jgi:multidrug efflux pump subunit AcrA (membrane-fusion protein)
MYAMATIETVRREGTLTLPASAVMRDAVGTFCYVIKDGKVARRGIEVGLRSGTDVELVGGATEQDHVVTLHPESLTVDQQVDVVEASSK